MTVAQVAAAAIVSRGWVSLMAMFSHAFITPYDTSAIAHSKSIFSAFAAWDGVYFVGIADQGYRYENTHAFFPLFPLLVRWTSPLMLPFLDKNASLLAAGWLISNASFVVAAVFLYLLGLEVLKTESVAKRAALLFCICPSGIFMSACYSESLMCALTFSGMYLLERSRTARRASGPMFLIFSALLFGLSSATRSNGILHSRTTDHRSRLRHRRFCGSLHCVLPGSGVPASRPCFSAVCGPLDIHGQSWRHRHWVPSRVLSARHRRVLRFLRLSHAGRSIGLPHRPVRAGRRPPVVQSSRSQLYGHVHVYPARILGSGAIRVLRAQAGTTPAFDRPTRHSILSTQIPNFLLAAPMLALAGYTSYIGCIVRPPPPFESTRPYFVHVAFLLVNVLVVVHIQVVTRFLAASPPIFWAASYLTSPDAKRQSRVHPVVTHGVVLYFLVFNVVGATLFPTFYPWT
ncbi:hypothetical protein H310_08950 [Aphanomyces invadans]|uniref:GPI mannosyltransferase 2 n=1 Tax=Aphanomyces invadans TaxID=157072 RepID=A0A024TW27_9STRA|nr:hypothetical protein H310_08950 [Aphanomyces invadans]ETV98228.1 hypothetical protein H310_08950 [Aphanomyces invadans]|eukprot:XP_008873103.1 hypothetical protein H310_08950 [Aphanomyces invadans]